jgi:Ser/Thr protein kinase RdoA (MazF antagonist)
MGSTRWRVKSATAWEADVPLNASAIQRVVTVAWGLDDPRAEPAGRGMNSRTWLVESGNARFIAKLVASDQHDRFVSGLAVSRLVEASGLPAGAPVETEEGSLWTRIGDHTLALLTFVDGRPLEGDVPAEQRLIGETLARVHRILTGRSVPGALQFHWIDPMADHLDVEPWLRPAIRSALEEWECVPPPPLSWGLLHTDPAPEAFLLHPESASCGLIDWDTGVVGPLMYDVASAVMYLGGPDWATAFVDAYVAAGDLPRKEVDRALEPMLRLRWAVQADYFARRIATNDLTGIAGPHENIVGLADARDGLGA